MRAIFLACLILVSFQGLANSEVLEYPEAIVIIGHGGSDPSQAVRDAMRQIRDVFGTQVIESKTKVENFVVKMDDIQERGFYSGSKLDRFYRGLFTIDGSQFALFEFSREFVNSLQSKARNTYATRYGADFSKLHFYISKRLQDSFGEEHNTEFSVTLSDGFRRFIDRYLIDLDKGYKLEVRNKFN